MAPLTRSMKRSLGLSPESNLVEPKRQYAPNVPLSQLVKHVRFWFSDGNIVLAAESDCFKVHKSQLARFCTVFDDMFGLPSNPTDQEMIEDCVVVRMLDSAKDLASFLDAVYNGHAFNFNTESASNFPAVAGVMRFATKYDCELFRKMLWSSLRMQYPSYPSQFFPITFELNPTSPVRVLLLARECELLDLLPSCFYHLSFRNSRLSRTITDEELGFLTPTDRKRVQKGKNAILRRLKAHQATILPLNTMTSACVRMETSPRWEVRSKCATLLADHWANQVTATTLAKGPLEVLYGAMHLPPPKPGAANGDRTDVFNNSPVLCSNCAQKYSGHIQSLSVTVQSNLIKDFKLYE